MNITPNDKVTTIFGPGKVLYQEGDTGVKAHRYCVELETVPPRLKNLHDKYGGVFCFDNEIDIIEETKTVEQSEFF